MTDARRICAIVGVGAIALLGLLAILGYLRGRQYDVLRGKEALEVVGAAAIQYFRETGKVPASLEDLVDRKMLRISADGKWIGVAFPTHRYGPVLLAKARCVNLSFPGTGMDKETAGPAHVFVSCKDVPDDMQDRVNAVLGVEWQKALADYADRAATQPHP